MILYSTWTGPILPVTLGYTNFFSSARVVPLVRTIFDGIVNTHLFVPIVDKLSNPDEDSLEWGDITKGFIQLLSSWKTADSTFYSQIAGNDEEKMVNSRLSK